MFTSAKAFEEGGREGTKRGVPWEGLKEIEPSREREKEWRTDEPTQRTERETDEVNAYF